MRKNKYPSFFLSAQHAWMVWWFLPVLMYPISELLFPPASLSLPQTLFRSQIYICYKARVAKVSWSKNMQKIKLIGPFNVWKHSNIPPNHAMCHKIYYLHDLWNNRNILFLYFAQHVIYLNLIRDCEDSPVNQHPIIHLLSINCN